MKKLSLLNQLFDMIKNDEGEKIRYCASLVLINCLKSLSIQSTKFEKSICLVYILLMLYYRIVLLKSVETLFPTRIYKQRFKIT